ncbi:MAG: aldolase/citrate lyase family protein [Thermoplasmatales archaeon]|jgi:2-keto-3-deoxy-L-rhamnonate aldolase RhmA|nr:aldolase/citrate lyase family protein [Thermoplasmatales archaeon]
MRIGTFITLGSAEICEMLGNKLDFAVIDAEHGVILDFTVKSLLRSIPGNVTPWIRVKKPDMVSTALDLGARAILVPQIRNMEELKEALDSFYYPPEGKRGWGPGRASRYGLDIMELIPKEKENELWIQIETAEALDIVDKIAGKEGIYGLFVGPGDLSLAIGHPGEFDNPELEKEIERIFNFCKGNSKKFGIFVGNAAKVKQWEEKGADVVILGADSSFFAEGFANAMKIAGRL